MGLFSRLAGFALLAALFGFILATIGIHSGLVNVPAIVCVCGLFVFGLLASYRPSQIARAMAAGLCDAKSLAPDALCHYVAILDRANQLAWVSGFVTCFISVLPSLGALESPGMIGVSIQFATVPLLYGAILAEFVIGPLRHSVIASHYAAGGDRTALPAPLRRATVALLAAACILALAAVFVYIFLVFSSPMPY